MSHQTGIQASEELLNFFTKAKDGHIRMMKMSIFEEQLILADHTKACGTWKDDYDKCVPRVVEEKMPCYILYRLDTKNNQGYEWLFIAYSPDFSEVRQKMLYAGTRATMKREFGNGHIGDELFGTVVDDISLEGYLKHLEARAADAPLTNAELELNEVKKHHMNTAINVNTKHQTMSSVSFPVSTEALNQLHCLKSGEINYVQLSIDIEKEEINLAAAEVIDILQLPSFVPKEEGRYHIFNFQHSHEGDYLESLVFIYSMPGYSCPIKQRMLYSSCLNNLMQYLKDEVGLEIAKKLEIDDGKELVKDFLYSEIHPVKNVHKQAFSKPKGPGGRGPKRMTKK
ncbi:twinfilin-2-like [Tubulanus polymorphus]|uniref:twinfilin-2-like n=1 Tax=Tubulanus polymorphus TaxID=672921 RepID=UPI003DA5CAE5